MSKKLLSVGAILALVAAVFVGVASTASAQSMSLCQTVDALVAAGVIAPDKVAAAKAAAGCGSTTSSACYSFTKDLTVGSTGADVSALQAKLSVSPATGYFGAITKAAVQAYQTSKGISATGYVGPLTRAALNACVVTTTTTTTTTTNTSSSLNGGAGELADVQILSTYSNEDVNEGENDAKVLAFELEADNGSDLDIKNVRLAFEHTGTGSKRLNKYIDQVKVWAGSDEVGSADASDFTENSDVYSKSIALSDAVVQDGEKLKFYVSVDAISNIDSDDLAQNWKVTLESVRFQDADGVTVTDDSTGELDPASPVYFSFEDLSSSGDLELKVSQGSSNPDADVVEVDETSDTNDVLLLEANIKAEGSEMTIDEIEFTVAPVGANANEIVKEWKLLVDGDEIDSVAATSIAASATGTLKFTDLSDDFVISKGKTAKVRVVADINDLGAGFDNGDSIKVSLESTNNVKDETNTDVEDENGDTVVAADRSGSAIGEIQTFFTDGISVTLVGTPTAVKTTGDAQASESDSGLFTITFDVEAFGNDVFIDKSNPLVSGGSGESDINITGTGTVTSSITTSSGEQTPIGTEGFRVAEGTTERFVITTNILATASGFFDVSLGSLAYALTDVDADTYFTSNLSEFKTPQLNLTDR